MSNVHGRAISGGTLPTEIWKSFAGAALADVAPTPFAPPPDEILHGRSHAATLAVAESGLRPGAALTASGSGYERCVADFHVEATPAAGGAGVRSDPERDATSPNRTARLTLPADAVPGGWRAVAVCDEGTGAGPRAEATFTVEGPPPTTAPATTTTTTRPVPTTATTTAPTVTNPRPTTTVPSTTSTRSKP
jgi:hypothetical protein